MEFDEASDQVARIVYCPVCVTNVDSDEEQEFCNNCDTEFFTRAVDDEEPSGDDFDGAIIFCAHCCTKQDAEGLGLRNYSCESCGQNFAVRLDAQVLAEHAMFG